MFQKQALRTIIPITTMLILGFMLTFLCQGAPNADNYYYISAELGYWGGTLNGGGLARGTKLVVPEGALSETMTISMEVSTDRSSYISFTFGPYDTVFDVPVEIQLSWSALKDFDTEDGILYYWDEDLNEWMEETTAVFDHNNKKATLYVDHFSSYYYPRR